MDTPQDTPILRFQTFVVGLLLFAIFGVLAFILTSFGGPADQDPRAGLRLEARATADQASAEVLEPIGWLRPDRDQLTAAAAVVAERGEAAPSEIVVPGSPTAIRQMAAQPPAEEDEPAENDEQAPETTEPAEAEDAAPSAEPDESDPSDPSDEPADSADSENSDEPAAN